MGALAAAFTAAFAGPNGNGTNTDGSPYAPSPLDAAALGAAVDNAIPNAQDLTAESTERARVDGILSGQVGDLYSRLSPLYGAPQAVIAETERAEAAEAQIAQNIGAEAIERARVDTILSGQVGDLYSRLGTTDDTARALAATVDGQAEGLSAETAARETLSERVDGVASGVADLWRLLPLMGRPGDAPLAFTSDLASGIAGVPPNASSIIGARGRALRIVGAATLASLGLMAIEPNRTYKVRAALSRAVDPVDPSGDAIRFALAWYGADGNQLPSIAFSVLADQALIVAAGRVQYEALLSLNPPDQTVPTNPRVMQPPFGASYFRPFLQTFGPDAVTLVEVLESADVTDAADGQALPLDAVLARLSRLEAVANLPAM